MAAWVIWAIVAVGLAVGEIFTPGLFFLAAIASLAFLRPIARRHLHMPARLRTGTSALVGARGVAIERIDAHGGRVKIGGELWTARAFDESQVIEPGTRVEIVKIEGATALVYE